MIGHGKQSLLPGNARRVRRGSRSGPPFGTMFLLILTGSLLLGPAPVDGSTQETAKEIPVEYQLKAAFLYNYVKFTTWPKSTFKDERSAYVIGVLGTNPFGYCLEKLVAKKTVRKRPIEIRHFKNHKDIRSCHVLFVSSSEHARLPKILKSLARSNVLTVSDMKGFVARGGMIHLFLKEKKIRFAVNFETINKQPFKISSKLLKLADNWKKSD